MPILNNLLTIAGAPLLLATLPGTVELMLVTAGVLRRPRRDTSSKFSTSTGHCRLAIVVPAHNEAALIARCVESLLASLPESGQHQIVVVADNCSDDTAKRAEGAGARVLVRHNLEQRGKGYALRTAFDQLQSEGFDAFLVVDADSLVSLNLVPAVIQRMSDGAGAVQCRYRVSNSEASLRARLMDVAFLAFNVLRPRGRSGMGLSGGILGNGFALSAATLAKVPYDAASIVEDLEYHLRLVAESGRVDFVDEATVLGEIPADSEAARVQRSRWEGGRLRMVTEWVPRLAGAVAHGQVRLLEPLLDLLTFPLAYHVLLLSALVLVPAFRAYAAVAFSVVAAHVLVAAMLGGQPAKSLFALASAPFYIVWKLTTLDAIFAASRKNAGWVRTGRDAELGLTAGEAVEARGE